MRASFRYAVMTVAACLVSAGGVNAKGPAPLLHAHLQGFQEVPSVSMLATGEFHATINPSDQSIDHELIYSGLQGMVTQAHIHVG
jgi:hypothetical protein